MNLNSLNIFECRLFNCILLLDVFIFVPAGAGEYISVVYASIETVLSLFQCTALLVDGIIANVRETGGIAG